MSLSKDYDIDQDAQTYETLSAIDFTDDKDFSKTEVQIIRAQYPVDIDEDQTEEIIVNGESGVWINRTEVNEWQGDCDISEYPILEDNDPLIISKPTETGVEYIQELAIRYLRPAPLQPPGEIIITQEPDIATAPAPPLIIRQVPARPETPEPLVIREEPPKPPAKLEQKIITIQGKRLPPPPRKVVLERLPTIPAKPQNFIIERWLPYAQVKRQVQFNPAPEVTTDHSSLRNLIIQWEEPEVKVTQEIKYLGTIKADPDEYLSRYGAEVVQTADLPEFVTDIPTPKGIVLAAEIDKAIDELIGDLEALRLVNLEAEGLGEYRAQLVAAGVIE